MSNQSEAVSKVVAEIGNAPTTESGYGTAIKLYNDFASHNELPLYKDLTIKYLKSEDSTDGSSKLFSLFWKFGSFLLLPILQHKSWPYYKPCSCTQYFSNLKTTMEKCFPKLSNLHPPLYKWYNHIYRLVKISSAKACMK